MGRPLVTENLVKGRTILDVPWVTSKRRLPFVLSKSRLDNYDVERVVTWRDDAPWPGTDRLLVLKQRAPDRPAVAKSPVQP